MKPNPCIEKMRHVLDLSLEEEAVLTSFVAPRVPIAKDTDIVTQGARSDRAFVICEGWVLRHRQLADGRRQILDFLLPGDWAGLTALMFDEADHTVAAVTDLVVVPVPFADLAGLARRQPRLAFAIFWTAAQEEAVIAEHLVDVGRRSAYERVGHLYLELLSRLSLVGAARDGAFAFPLNQATLADALGLSQVHVNRTIQRLRQDGLVLVDGRRVVIPDRAALERAVDFETAYLHMGGLPVWLARRLEAAPV